MGKTSADCYLLYMGIFGSKSLDYRAGNGSLAKIKPTKYFPHHLPGEPTLTQMDFELLQEEARNGKHAELMGQAINFAITLDYLDASYDYSNRKIPEALSDPTVDSPGNSTEDAMKFLANSVKQYIDNSVSIYFELLPYLERFEECLAIEFNVAQRRSIMCIMRIGMGLSLIENKSGLNVQGFCHPSVSNVLLTPRQVLIALSKSEFSWNLDVLNGHEREMDVVQLALYVGYFQSKYTAETPGSVMEYVKPLTK